MKNQKTSLKDTILKLAKIADDFDSIKLHKEANIITNTMLKLAQTESLLMQTIPNYIKTSFGTVDAFIQKFPALAGLKQVLAKLVSGQPLNELEKDQLRKSILQSGLGNLEVLPAVEEAKKMKAANPTMKLIDIRNSLAQKYTWLNNGQDPRFQSFNQQLLAMSRNNLA